jgi:acyl-coenzyme A thioesterase PaaI-like protein
MARFTGLTMVNDAEHRGHGILQGGITMGINDTGVAVLWLGRLRIEGFALCMQ